MDRGEMRYEEAKGIIEALLFTSSEPLSVGFISEVIGVKGESEVERILEDLKREYDARGGAIRIAKVAGGFVMCTHPRFAPWIRAMKGIRKEVRLSPAALETLAIIAYKQPITKAEIEVIRGVKSDSPLEYLMEKGLVRVVGRKEVPGRPYLYGTTQKFLSMFGLSSLRDLPRIEEVEDEGEAE
jgi:segregation and condensation protein B